MDVLSCTETKIAKKSYLQNSLQEIIPRKKYTANSSNSCKLAQDNESCQRGESVTTLKKERQLRAFVVQLLIWAKKVSWIT